VDHTLHQQLASLARSYGVLNAFHDGFGRRCEAPVETRLAVLRELGAEVDGLGGAGAALERRRLEIWRRWVEPVCVVWNGEAGRCLLRLPAPRAGQPLKARLVEESGSERTWDVQPGDLPDRHRARVAGEDFVVKALPLPSLPLGYHRLELETAGLAGETLLIAAPVEAHVPPPDAKHWGVFLPLYALHSRRSWGAGDFTDLEALLRFTKRLGGDVVGTLPLLAAYLEEPFDPSPYRPVSRLFWNEFYVDPERVPELELSARAQRSLNSKKFRNEVAALREGEFVDHRRLMALKRPVLEALARSLMAKPSQRRDEFSRYVAERPDLEAYARFRAAVEKRRQVWPEWPAAMRQGELREGDYDEPARLYHLYAQWLAEQQLSSLSRTSRGKLGLYLDLPLGVHPEGFDVWREPESFAQGASGGSPPDSFFTKGQDWAFAPLHPERERERGYHHFILCLRNHFRHAGALRIDHVMGMHRLYWIPRGMPASQGTYVLHHADELYAIACLESQRERAVLIGEDLGTVPPYVQTRMKRHGLRRMWVGAFQFRDDAENAISPPDRECLASLNTHDMRPFSGFWDGLDIDDQLELGLIEEQEGVEVRSSRWRVRAAVVEYLRRRGRLKENTPQVRAALEGCLEELAASEAETVLVNLEDLWGETGAQNTPGTVDERPNWRRRARLGLDQFRRVKTVAAALRRVNELRRANEP